MSPGGELLLVEDDPDDAELTLLALRPVLGERRVVLARNGAEALAHLQRSGGGLPALVLLDLRMPVMDGFEFLRRLRAAWGPGYRGAKVAILSSSNEERDVAAARELGVSHYFRKPITAHQSSALAREVGTLLQRA